MDWNLQVEENPTRAEIEFIDDRIYDYNAARTGKQDGQWLMILERDEKGEMRAGLHGWTWAGCCEVLLLWVREELRGQGLGTALLQAAEREAAARGCSQVILDSYSFQAPGFYQKHGYEVTHVLDDFPPGYKRYYFRKRLEGEAFAKKLPALGPL